MPALSPVPFVDQDLKFFCTQGHEPLSAVCIEASIVYDLVQLELTGYASVSCYLQRKFLISLVMKESEGK